MEGTKVAGNLFAAGVAILLVILALILAYDGWKAFRRYKSGESAVPSDAEKATA